MPKTYYLMADHHGMKQSTPLVAHPSLEKLQAVRNILESALQLVGGEPDLLLEIREGLGETGFDIPKL